MLPSDWPKRIMYVHDVHVILHIKIDEPKNTVMAFGTGTTYRLVQEKYIAQKDERMIRPLGRVFRSMMVSEDTRRYEN